MSKTGWSVGVFVVLVAIVFSALAYRQLSSALITVGVVVLLVAIVRWTVPHSRG